MYTCSSLAASTYRGGAYEVASFLRLEVEESGGRLVRQSAVNIEANLKPRGDSSNRLCRLCMVSMCSTQ